MAGTIATHPIPRLEVAALTPAALSFLCNQSVKKKMITIFIFSENNLII
jgi:hypothetical protein